MADNLDEIREEAEEKVLVDVGDGVQMHSTDGTSTSLADPVRRLEALHKSEDRKPSQGALNGGLFGAYVQQGRPPGGGGSP